VVDDYGVNKPKSESVHAMAVSLRWKHARALEILASLHEVGKLATRQEGGLLL
jgi:hypothetical protein